MKIINITIVRLKSLGCNRSRLRTGAGQTTRTTILIYFFSEWRLNMFIMLYQRKYNIRPNLNKALSSFRYFLITNMNYK